MVLAALTALLLSGPSFPPPLLKCVTACERYEQNGWVGTVCWYDERPKCLKWEPECDKLDAECVPRVKSLGGWLVVPENQTLYFYEPKLTNSITPLDSVGYGD